MSFRTWVPSSLSTTLRSRRQGSKPCSSTSRQHQGRGDAADLWPQRHWQELDHPELVRGKRVLDFAAGSGLVAIAAMLAGAKSAQAVDIDEFSVEAVRLNAAANSVEVDIQCADLVGQTGEWDTVLAGDICYDRDMVALVLPWLQTLRRSGKDVVIGDPGRAFLPKKDLLELAEYRVATTRAIEDTDVKRTKVFRLID